MMHAMAKRGAFLLASTCGVCALPHVAISQDSQVSVGYYALNSIDIRPSSVTEFEARWSAGGGGDYLARETWMQAPTDRPRASSQDIKSGYTEEAKRQPIKMVPDAKEAIVKAQECGPSPLEPAAIEQMVKDAASRHGVDPVYATAIAWAESNFDRSRNSSAGARGPMQLMPETAERFGVSDICDPAANIEGGIKYLRWLLDEFKNPLLAAAAYNSGEGRIYEHGGVPPFPETVAYVAKVVNYQLGVPMPSRNRTPSPFPTPKSPVVHTAGEPAGVLPVAKNRQFVGGVMHF